MWLVTEKKMKIKTVQIDPKFAQDYTEALLEDYIREYLILLYSKLDELSK